MGSMNFYEKTTTTTANSLSASLPNTYHLENHIRNMESAPKNIISTRRKSESFAEYSGQEFVYTQTTQNCHLNNDHKEQDGEDWRESFSLSAAHTDSSAAFMSPDTLNHHFYPHFQGQQQSISTSSSNLDKKIVLYKTEMCRTFEETGICKYGIKCQFAHDPVEVRNIPRHPRYKTEICKTFWQLGNCPYGKRCCFIHTEHELKEGKSSTTSTDRNTVDIYGTVDLNITEDQIQSSNHSSQSGSPSKVAEELKRSITNIGTKSIFNNISDFLGNNGIERIDHQSAAVSPIESTQPSVTSNITLQRRKSIFEDKLNEELAMMIGTGSFSVEKKRAEAGASAVEINNNNITRPTSSTHAQALSSNDPEYNTKTNLNTFNFWSQDPKTIKGLTTLSIEEENDAAFFNKINISTDSTNSKFDLFDKSPGSKGGLFSSKVPTGAAVGKTNDIWAKNGNPFIFSTGTEKQDELSAQNLATSVKSSGTSSKTSTGSGSPTHYLLMDMINLLDSQ